MGWFTMPDTVQESAFERQIKEGKAYQISEEFTITAGATQWVYIQLPAEKDVILEARNIAATAGPIRYRVYPQPDLIGPLGDAIIPEKLNTKKNGASLTEIHKIAASSIDVSGITPTDKKLNIAGQDSGSRGNGGTAFQNFFKVYSAGLTVAVSITNNATISSIVELNYIWAEDVE